MSELNGRQWRLQQLLHKQKQKMKKVSGYGVLFEECVEALGAGTVILSEEKSKEIYHHLANTYPITSWARIDWDQIKSKMKIESGTEIASQIKQVLEDAGGEVFILWSHGDQPVLQAKLDSVFRAIDDVTAVSADTFILSPSRYIIEFHHEGEITIGFENHIEALS